MNDKMLEYFIDPIKGKILLEINNAKRISVKGLCTKCTNIPRSTMYRHLSRMEKNGVIEVVERRKIRGTIEKTYALNSEAMAVNDDGTDTISKELYLNMFVKYCIDFIDIFKKNIEEGLDVKKEISGFTTAPFYATDGELKIAVGSISRIIQDLVANPSAPERKMHSMGLIISPPMDSP